VDVSTPEDYRAELADLLGVAAVQGKIPARFRAHNRSLVVEFAQPSEAGWYIHRLVRSDSRLWWQAVQPHPPRYAGLMPEIGDAIGQLRELHRAAEVQLAASEALRRLKRRLFGPTTPADMPLRKPELADHGDPGEPAERYEHGH